MAIVFIKAGGSGNIIHNKSVSLDYSWLFYRKINIDHEYFRTLIKYIGEASKQHKIGLSIGGVGTYLLLNFAQQMGYKNEKLHRIGAEMINITTSVLIDSFKAKKFNVCPQLVEVNNNLEEIFDVYDLVLFKATSKYWSSDSSVADAASRVPKSKLIFFKTNLLERNEKRIANLNISDLRTLTLKKKRTPGIDPLIDIQALNLIRKYRIDTILCSKELICKLEKIIENNIKSNKLIKLAL